MSELKLWSERVLAAQSSEEVFAALDEFRPLPWNNEERATIAKIYNAKLYQIKMSQAVEVTKPTGKAGKIKNSSNISKQDAGNQRGESTSSTKELDEDEISL